MRNYKNGNVSIRKMFYTYTAEPKPVNGIIMNHAQH